MDYKHTIDILSENVKELGFIIDGFATNKRIPALELDLVLAKTRNLYDVLLMLKKYAVEDITQDMNEQENTKVNAPTSENESKKDENRTEITGGKDIIELESAELIVSKSFPENKKEKKDDEQTEISKTLTDRFKKQSISLHDNLIQSNPLYDLSAKLQSKPLLNITNAIGLNERFSYIQELFRGDADKYNETMQVLNNASDFNEAYNYLIENFQWDMDSDLVQKILDLIRRKFITSKNE